VPADLEGRPLDAIVRAVYGGSWNAARTRIERGKIHVDGATVTDPLLRPRAGAELELHEAAPRPAREGDLHDAAVVHLDAHLVVVDKPAGISTVPFDDDERGTLDELVRRWLSRRARAEGRPAGGRPALGIVHRLDRETTGLLVFTRTWLAKQGLTQQFRLHSVRRRYLALAHGDVPPQTIRSRLVADRGDGRRGSAEASRFGRALRPDQGQPAVTHVEPLERLAGATLVACRLETGRTHQIRIHLAEAGHPLLGERVYRPRDVPALEAPRVMLHAEELGFVHPAAGTHVAWRRDPPADFRQVLERLRRRRRA
jgi:23S rRNA pseudouridine1911/1915/1917 synthase